MFNKKYSLYIYLTLGIVIIISLVMSSFTFYWYHTSKERKIEETLANSELTISSLKNNIQTYIESYSPNEYEKIVSNQLSNRYFLAILVEDYQTGKILGEDIYLSGKIKVDFNKIVDFDSQDPTHKATILDSFYQLQEDIYNKQNIQIGKVTIFLTDHYIQEELNQIILEIVISVIVLSFILILALFLIINYLILNPISRIVNHIEKKNILNTKCCEPINSSGAKEIFVLSDTMNKMLEAIKISQKVLIANEKRYKTLLDSMVEYVFIKDKNSKYLVVNKALKEFFRKEYVEIIGKNDFEILGKKDCFYIDNEQDIIKNSMRVFAERQISNKIYQVHKFPVILNSNHIGIGGFIIDITEAKQKELQILEAKKKLDITLEASKIGIWERSVDSYDFIWDKNCFEMLGYENNELDLSFDNWKNLFEEGIFEEIDKDVKNQLTLNHKFLVEHKLKRKDGSWAWVEVNGVFLKDSKGRVIKIVGTHLDITGSKEYELVLKKEVDKKTQELNRLNETLKEQVLIELEKNKQQDELLQRQSRLAALGEMLGNIAHQWRQPLSAITAAISALKLKNEFGILESSDITEANDHILNQAEFLSQTIENFRNFFKKDQPIKEFFISNSIKSTIHIIKASYENNFITLETKLDDNIKYYGNENLLSQVFLNILTNAKDVLVANKINDKYVFLELLEDDEYIKILITDNAGGVSEEIIDKIFDPHFTTKQALHGTGLGLYMSSIILNEHFNKGFIKVSNTQNSFGVGACFEITIPKIPTTKIDS
ncbi:MAG: PAS domain S-box protein [Arcobacter butzleri]|nr:PAS domain S-box protein [Aliarcobacter butzleri]